MKLREPASSIWRRHRHAVDRLRTETGDIGRLMLGGGSILGARWEHRASTDIDVLLPDRDALNDAHPDGPNDLAAATGGRASEVWKDRVKVSVDNGLLDVTAATPLLPGMESQEEVEGRRETVLATAQILRGKLNRTHKGLTRDAFDLVSAAKADERALEQAVNALTRKEWHTVCRNLIKANDDIAAEAEETLGEIDAAFKTDMRRLGHDAAIAVAEARYTHVRVRAADGIVVIESQSGKRPPHVERHAGTSAQNALTRSGIGEYLSSNTTAGRRTVAAALEKLMNEHEDGIVFDSDDPRPWERSDRVLGTARRKRTLPGGDPNVLPPDSGGGRAGGTDPPGRNRNRGFKR